MNQSISRYRINSIFLLAAVATMTALSSGCSTMTSMMGPLPVSDKQPAVEAAYGEFAVEVHSNFGAPRQYKGKLTGTKTVSEALSEAKAIGKFQAPSVEILRVVEKDGKSRGLRMPVEYDASAGGPTQHQDYALLDGDRVVVRPKESGGLVKVLTTIMGAN